jgi:hypothetical protein
LIDARLDGVDAPPGLNIALLKAGAGELDLFGELRDLIHKGEVSRCRGAAVLRVAPIDPSEVSRRFPNQRNGQARFQFEI